MDSSWPRDSGAHCFACQFSKMTQTKPVPPLGKLFFLDHMKNADTLSPLLTAVCVLHIKPFFISPLPSPPRHGMLRGMSYQAFSEWGRYFWRVEGRTHPQGVIPSRCCVRSRGLGMAVELGHTWCVRHGIYDPCVFFRQQRHRAVTLNHDVRARRQAPPQAKLRHSRTAPAGG